MSEGREPRDSANLFCGLPSRPLNPFQAQLEIDPKYLTERAPRNTFPSLRFVIFVFLIILSR
jgi:hypothetical protein